MDLNGRKSTIEHQQIYTQKKREEKTKKATA
jgi:hypothetical protein